MLRDSSCIDPVQLVRLSFRSLLLSEGQEVEGTACDTSRASADNHALPVSESDGVHLRHSYVPIRSPDHGGGRLLWTAGILREPRAERVSPHIPARLSSSVIEGWDRCFYAPNLPVQDARWPQTRAPFRGLLARFGIRCLKRLLHFLHRTSARPPAILRRIC